VRHELLYTRVALKHLNRMRVVNLLLDSGLNDTIVPRGVFLCLSRIRLRRRSDGRLSQQTGLWHYLRCVFLKLSSWHDDVLMPLSEQTDDIAREIDNHGKYTRDVAAQHAHV